tara:strand:- start:170 stop:895 length:726 start_codon:yes stop_codon:yes gene_type:complete
MASIELLKPSIEETPHLFYLLPFIHAFRQKHSPIKKCSDYGEYQKDNHLNYLKRLDFYKKEFSEEKFFEYVESNIDEILNEVNLRWALSILTCYADGHSDTNLRLQANQICNLIRFDSYHLSFVDRVKIDKKKYNKLCNDFWKGKSIKKIPIKYLDGFWNNVGNTDSINLLYMRNYKLITDTTLTKIFRFCVSKLILHWSSLFKIGARGYTIEDIDEYLKKFYDRAEYNEKTFNDIISEFK